MSDEVRCTRRSRPAATRAKLILALLALAGEPMGRRRIHEHLVRWASASEDGLGRADLEQLRADGLVGELPSRGYAITPDFSWPAIAWALHARQFNELREVYQTVTPLRVDWQGTPMLRSYRQGVALLRMALLAGEGPKPSRRCWRPACAATRRPTCTRWSTSARGPSRSDLIERINGAVRDDVLRCWSPRAARAGQLAPPVRAYAEEHVARGGASMALRTALAEHLILCGRLDAAGELLADLDESATLYFPQRAAAAARRHRTGAGRLRQSVKSAAPRDRQAQSRVRGHRRPPVRDRPAAQQRSETRQGRGELTWTAPPAPCRATTPPSTSSCRCCARSAAAPSTPRCFPRATGKRRCSR
jgi:hypothetical protein